MGGNNFYCFTQDGAEDMPGPGREDSEPLANLHSGALSCRFDFHYFRHGSTIGTLWDWQMHRWNAQLYGRGFDF